MAFPVVFVINTTHKIPCAPTTNYPCLWQTSIHSLKLTASQTQENTWYVMSTGCSTPAWQDNLFLAYSFAIKGCFDQAVKHEIPPEHPSPGKKPSLQWVTCYSLGDKDQVSTELFSMAQDWSLSVSPMCNIASLWSFPLKLLRAHRSCSWPFADHTKKVYQALGECRTQMDPRGTQNYPTHLGSYFHVCNQKEHGSTDLFFLLGGMNSSKVTTSFSSVTSLLMWLCGEQV